MNKVEMNNEAQRQADYFAAIGRALPDDDDDLESFDTQDQFSEVMTWVIGTVIVLVVIAVAAFAIGVTKP